jgi:hypothetical protein
MSVLLTQAEADALLSMEKHRTNDDRVRLPDTGGSVVVPLVSADGVELFHLDISRSRINLAKGKYQNRARVIAILARIDIGGAPHRNPDDIEVPCPHIHLYREGFGDRWAFPVAAEEFANSSDHWQTLMDFVCYCNVTRPPEFERGLFS